MRLLVMEVVGLPHCPRNRSHFLSINWKKKIPMESKTEAATSYEKALLHHLAKFKNSASAFRESFNKDTQYLTALWEITSPEVLTKAGKVSENGTDLDAHKVLQDTVMGFIGIDDAYIMRDTRGKSQGDYRVTVSLVIHDLDNGEGML